MSWNISFYSQKVEEQILSFPSGILASFLHIAEMIEEFGPNLGKPYVARVSSGLYEIRARGPEGIARYFYCSQAQKKIVILHSIIKKTQKTPIRDMKLAKQRMKKVLE